MKYIFTCIATIFMVTNSYATNYYVDGINGSDGTGRTGLSIASAFKTIGKAANLTFPGDIVYIMNGTYGNFNINRSGNASAQIVYTNFPGHLPKLQANATTYALIYIEPGTSYITINGLEISGYGVNLSLAADSTAAKAQVVCPTVGNPATSINPLAKYNGGGITVPNSNGIGSHHLIITNNIVHDCTKEGMAFANCDYITVTGNRVYNNSWYTIYGTSGITFNEFFNFDNNTTTYRNVVRDNICYGNRLYVPYYSVCKISDGNGIILDIPKANYNGKSLVANNICFNNGGSGIHTFKMNNTDIFNNVSYLNAASPESNSPNIYALEADNVRIVNNIIVARPGKKMNGLNASTNLLYDYNIFYGGSNYELVGTHSIIQDPKFVNPSTNPNLADFHLQNGSLAINAGNNAFSYPTDYEGNVRPISGTVDMGAFESSFSGTTVPSGVSSLVISNGNGNGLGESNAGILYGPAETKPSVSNARSRRAMIYPTSLLTTIPANTVITSLKFRRAVQNTTTNTTPSTQAIPNNAGFRVYLRNESGDQFPAGDLDWNSILPDATNPSTLVYGGDATSIVSNFGGWKEIAFQVPFTYTGGNLAVFVEYFQNGSLSGGSDINWIYDNSGPQPAYSGKTNGYKYVTASGNTTIGNLLNNSNERRPVITFNYANGALPVKLVAFNAKVQNNLVAVTWTTATETNNAGFEVQRSIDGIHFETVGSVAPNTNNGNSVDLQRYYFDDKNPFLGTSYYHLSQKDLDGKIDYSQIRAVSFSIKEANKLIIYPNPAVRDLNLTISSTSNNEQAKISIIDANGRMIQRNLIKKLVKGLNNINLDISDLPIGIYTIVVEMSAGEKLVEKFIKR
ncbi:hypothetical protein A5893_02440 [Pedobacter psychrophilus]|uniref:Secretion system C-terminal sorting domain-containing protein n=1 Tax=Pedobacter psychrophilus TaxID=1826909 RepID=A0A179DN62_9SPHI|nr:T9SS type A sorting domain-containing protein [Pedobacter psychrophilus]OAQ41999.1 hypothetical protein A5893_02440 [Pedobacter psychrophilus]